ncbi:hypothetical protein Leryth_003555 [Lithospermum erythrorhizon]|nr:hypothetical protein Leryth_003555 [Lithospermum erythrorhizon]
MRKIRNLKLPRDEIKDVDLYHTTPDEVTAEYEPVGDNKWYFFTSRKKKYRNGRRPDRSTGSGYWKATGADKPIKFRHQVVGYKNSLVFYQGKPPNGPRTNWIMHEFRVEQISERKKTHENDMTLDDWVLCRIYKKNDNKASSSSRNLTISVEDNNCHTQPKPELVEVDDEKPPQPIDSIEDCMEKDQDYYYIMYGQTPEYYFNNYNVSLLDSSNPGVNDDQNGFFNSYEANPSGYSMNPAPHYTMDSLETWSIFKSCHQSYL